MNWIFVKDELPKQEGEYLVYTKNKHYAIATYTNKYVDMELPSTVRTVDWYWDFFPNTSADVVAWTYLTGPTE